MTKPRLLDLFCGAGGATKGYQRAGFYVVGVDIKPQPHYCGDEFIQSDALEYVAEHGREFDAIHASPPCQAYSSTASLSGNIYPRLIEPIRTLLIKSLRPYVIENVVRAPLVNPTLICGTMFGLKTYRHRLFETSFLMPLIMHLGHGAETDKLSGLSIHRKKEMVTVVGHGGYKGANERYRIAMDIDWMNSNEITEAIPPAYTEFIGDYLMQHITPPAAVQPAARLG